ncbi:MAG: putative quinol monooxygenase [Litorimonas sp.]
MIIVLGSAQVKPGQVDAALALSLTHVHRSRGEAGCISHDVSVDAENPTHLMFTERWADMSALLTHFSLDASKRFVAELTPMLSEAPEMRIYNADEVKVGR